MMLRRASLLATGVLLSALSTGTSGSDTSQVPLSSPIHASDEWTTFPHPIRRVAIIGAGPAGLQAAAALRAEGQGKSFPIVRLFERDENPGGNWRYSDGVPVREAYPDRPLHLGAYVPDIRPNGTVEWYKDGDEGISLDERWREGARPSLIWNTLHTNSPQIITSLPGIEYPPDTPWILSAHEIQRHVRTYASYHGLNANDASSLPGGTVSYSTRVEYAHKNHTSNTWTLSLRKLERSPSPHPGLESTIKATWWEEEFDALVVAIDWDAVHVPDIKGLDGEKGWSNIKKAEDGKHAVWHSQGYRRPEPLANKTVLIVGASTSAVEISRDIGPHVKKLYVSIRDHTREGVRLRMFMRLWPGAEVIPEIEEFVPLEGGELDEGITGGRILLKNGSSVGGIDEIILATGLKRSYPFLRDYIGTSSSPANPTFPSSTTSKLLPVLSEDIHGWQALHWTGHYIPDPTLAFANVRPWTTGRFQVWGFAKVWAGTARIPSERRMWELYRGPGKEFFGDGLYGTPTQENRARYFVAWLNSESLKFGGRFVDNLPHHLENRETYIYFMNAIYGGLIPGGGLTSVKLENFTRIENSPASEWDGQVPEFDWDRVLEDELLPW